MHKHRWPSYEIHEGIAGSYWIIRVADGSAAIVDRFEDLEQAQDFVDFMEYFADAPRRLATH